jgi:hypothetical protein
VEAEARPEPADGKEGGEEEEPFWGGWAHGGVIKYSVFSIQYSGGAGPGEEEGDEG